MAEKSTWIKLDRNILEWRWYKQNNTKALFIHLLIKANIKDRSFMGMDIKRGQLVTSYSSLSKETGMSLSALRKAMGNLETTNEITRRSYHDYSIITIENYDLYQGDVPISKPQPEEKTTSVKRQQTRQKKRKEIRKEEAPVKAVSAEYVPQYWELPLDKQYWGRFRSEDEYYEYRQNGGE